MSFTNETTAPVTSLKSIVFKGFFLTTLSSFTLNVLQFLSRIILARLLAPDDFGVVALAISIISVIGFFQDFGLGSALVQRKKEIEESFNTVFLFSLFLSVIFITTLFVAAPYFAHYFQDTRLVTILRLIAITLSFGALSTPSSWYISKNLLFFRKFITETIPLLVGSIVTLFFAWYGHGYLSLVLGYLIGSALSALLSFFLSPWRPSISFRFDIFKELLHYGTYIFFSNIAAVLLAQGDNAIVGRILGTTQLGYYALAYTLATLPLTNIAHIISKVMFPLFGKLQDDPVRLNRTFTKSMLIISTINFPIVLGTTLISPWLIHVILGEKWLPIQTPLIILLALGFFKSLQIIPSFFLQATGHPNNDAKIISSSMLLAIIVTVPLTHLFGITGTAIGMTLAYAWGVFRYLLKCFRILDQGLAEFTSIFLPGLAAASIMFLFGRLIIHFFITTYTITNLITLIMISALIYTALLFLFKRAIFSELKFVITELFQRNNHEL